MLRTLISELRALPRFVYVLLLAAVFAGVFLATHRDWRLYQKLYNHGVHTTGWVTSKDIMGGRNVDYAFRVGEKLYRGTSASGYGNPPFADLRLDDSVLLFYLPSDPSVSALGDAKQHIQDQHRWMAWAMILLLPAFGLALAGELRRHSQ
jgi:hypothetical protein